MTDSTGVARIAPAAAAALLLVLAVGSSVMVAVRKYERGARNAPAPEVSVAREPAAGAIEAEAAVWRGAAASFAPEPRLNRRPRAHPRTLTTWRMRRAFPGAPPRIPHGLTPLEARTASCNPCHARGGYSQRFAAHTPVTPHPELQPCTQCHVSDAAVVGIDLPGATATPDASCRQCHFPASAPARSVAADVQTSTWPRRMESTHRDAPPAIPHDLQLRGNCLACHSGPGAVQEIRTSHPERANCRQCHVQPDGAELYERRRTGYVASNAGGVP